MEEYIQIMEKEIEKHLKERDDYNDGIVDGLIIAINIISTIK